MIDFNKERFFDLWRWELSTYRKVYRNLLLAASGSMLAMMMLVSGFITSLLNFQTFTDYDYASTTLMAVMIILVMLGVAGSAFTNMRTNQERLAFIMLPASTAEKFVVRTACRLLVCLGILFVSAVAATAVFALLVLLSTGHFYWAVPMGQLLRLMFLDVPMDNGLQLLAVVLLALNTWTVYILGSVFFRRHALVFTTFCIVGASIVLSILTSLLGVYALTELKEWIDEMDYRVTVEFLLDPETLAMIILDLVLALWLLLDLSWAYRLFARMQVINNRWNNKTK